MTTPPEGPTEAIARRVSALRKRKGLNRQQLGEAMTAAGVEWNRFTVSSLESGKRQNVTVVELLALARVLDVAPVHLLVPIEDQQPYRVTPNEVLPAHRVRPWVRGIVPLPGMDPRIFTTEVPLAELTAWSGEDRPVPGED